MTSYPSLRTRLIVLATLAFALLAVALVPAARSGEQRLPYEDPSLPIGERVADLISRMTLAEKVGQMTQTERIQVYERPEPDHRLEPGQHPLRRRLGPEPQHARRLGRHGRPASSARRCDTRLQIPLLYGVDSVHGHGNLLGATVFPHNIGLGATRDPALVREDRRTSPPRRPARAGRSGRSRPASASPATTAGAAPTRASARPRDWSSGWRPRSTASRGRRGQLAHADRVLATAKHYAGDGDTDVRDRQRRLPDRPGHRPVTSRRDVLAGKRPAPVRARGAGARRRLRDAVVLERRLDRGRRRQPDQDARQPRADHRRAQGRARLRRLRDQRLGGHPPDPGRLRATQVRTGVNAGIDMFMEPNPTTRRTSSRR